MARFIAILLFFLISLLAVFRAPAFPLWMLSVLVQELPWIFVGIALLLLLTGGYAGKYGLANALLCAVALVLYVSPVIRAYRTAQGLGRRLGVAFKIIEIHGDSDDVRLINAGKAELAAADRDKPFQWTRMFKGMGVKPVAYRTLNYSTPDGVNLTLDVYPGQKPGPRPCVMVIHGGSWSGGDSRQLPELNSRLAGGYWRDNRLHQLPAGPALSQSGAGGGCGDGAWLYTGESPSVVDRYQPLCPVGAVCGCAGRFIGGLYPA